MYWAGLAPLTLANSGFPLHKSSAEVAFKKHAQSTELKIGPGHTPTTPKIDSQRETVVLPAWPKIFPVRVITSRTLRWLPQPGKLSIFDGLEFLFPSWIAMTGVACWSYQPTVSIPGYKYPKMRISLLICHSQWFKSQFCFTLHLAKFRVSTLEALEIHQISLRLRISHASCATSWSRHHYHSEIHGGRSRRQTLVFQCKRFSATAYQTVAHGKSQLEKEYYQ